MKILFVHPRFPGQFWHLVRHLADDPGNTVLFITNHAEETIKNVRTIVYTVPADADRGTHPFVQPLEKSVMHGQAVAQLALQLKKEGLAPDIIYGYDGWGATIFLKEIFPHTPFLCYFEWYVNAHGAEYNFDPECCLSLEQECAIRCYNAATLINLTICDQGISPLQWQKQQFPPEFQHKISVIFDGVDTEIYFPMPVNGLQLPRLGLDLSDKKEVVTYGSRGFEPFDGFPQFMQSVALLQQRRPRCHVVIAGFDHAKTFYGRSTDGKTCKEKMMTELSLDMRRLHFTGWLSWEEYLRLLRSSQAHVYLTRPHVLSWSLMEAMASGCMVIASDTPPVQEVIKDGENGVLTNFFDTEQLTAQIERVLDDPETYVPMRQQAHQMIQKQYSKQVLLPQQLELLNRLIGK
ncbi:MAG TPA: glycosyltransferase [Patescibacteria group bacterium]|nr:glycosyltransferase [Patescibacteria group bacterium]